jgi:hypothetical protein
MKRTYVVHGRYGYFAVDEHNDQDSGVRGPLVTRETRKRADHIAAALNRAYQDGREDQATDSRDLVERAYAQGRDMACDHGESYMGTIPADVSRETTVPARQDTEP